MKFKFSMFGKSFAIDIKSGNSRSFNDRFFGVDSSSRDSSNFNSTKQFLNAYNLITYVGGATNIIASDVSELDYAIYDNRENQQDIKLTDLMMKPNPLMSWKTMIHYAMMHLCLTGDAFFIPDITNKYAELYDDPNELRLLVPSSVYIRSHNDMEIRATTQINTHYIKRYEINDGYSMFDLMPEEVMHAKYPSPNNFIRGMGVIQRGTATLDGDMLQNIFDKLFYANGGNFDYAMQIKDDSVGLAEAKIHEKRFKDKYTGSDNYRKIPFVPPGYELIKLGMTQREMEFIEKKEFTRKDVYCSMFQIPPVRSGVVDDANYDSADEQTRTYHNDTLPGYYTTLEETISEFIQYKTKKPLFFRFIKKDTRDIEKVSIVVDRAYQSGVVDGDEYRERIKLPQGSSPHLSEFYANINRVPVSMLSEQDDPEETNPDDDKKLFELMDIKGKAPKKMFQLHKHARRTQKNEMESIFKRAVSKYYKGLVDRILKEAEKGYNTTDTKTLNIDDLIVFADEKKLLDEVSLKMYSLAIGKGVKSLNEFFDVSVSLDDVRFKLKTETLSIKFVNQQLESRKKEVQSIINSALEDGEPITEITARLKDHFSPLIEKDGWKLDRIARTEANNTYNQASEIVYRDIGVQNVQVIGCEQKWPDFDCDTDGSRGTYNIEKMGALNFHPNHGGSIVPVLEG